MHKYKSTEKSNYIPSYPMWNYNNQKNTSSEL